MHLWLHTKDCEPVEKEIKRQLLLLVSFQQTIQHYSLVDSQGAVWMVPTIAGISGAGLFVRNPNTIRNVKVILKDYFEQVKL